MICSLTFGSKGVVVRVAFGVVGWEGHRMGGKGRGGKGKCI